MLQVSRNVVTICRERPERCSVDQRLMFVKFIASKVRVGEILISPGDLPWHVTPRQLRSLGKALIALADRT
jgi:hypothetical protein